ncbi:MAG: mCpol domain-containing protein [Euryarchaeota archaeon]|nr:mCpol domain-containing protein [Euryarchaeota archaeon]
MDAKGVILIYIGLDGDDIGKKIERCLIENNEREAARLSKEITNSKDKIADYFSSLGFEIIFSAGDDILTKGTSISIEDLTEFLQNVEGECSFSVGIANTLTKTYVALKYAKSIGKNVIVEFNQEDKLKIYKKIREC